MSYYVKLIIGLMLIASCNSSDSASINQEKEDSVMNAKGSETAVVSIEKQINLSVLWDLSDRIDPLTNPAVPQHYERDLEIIKTIAGVFKDDMGKKGAYKAKGKIRVFFTPTPDNEKINTIAGNLVYDLSVSKAEGANKKKKEIYDSIQDRFARNSKEIYQLTIETNKDKKQWEGSDIWRFFKNDVKDYCIEPGNSYRNVLIILTDGYIYHRD